MADQVLGAQSNQNRDRRSASVTVDLVSSSQTDSVDIRGFCNFSIGFPASMASTNIDIQVSHDNSTWFDLYTRDGTQVRLTTTSSKWFDVPELAGATYMRIETDADDSDRDFILMGKV